MIITIIPAKPFSEAKTRLASVLIPAERERLSRRLFKQTVQTASHLGPVLVVSRSATVRQLGMDLGATALSETGHELNAAVQQGLAWASRCQADGYLVIPTDLPFLTMADLVGMTTVGLATKPAVVIAPCQREQGTNALFLNPADIIFPQFGPNSFQAHQAAAAAVHVAAKVYRSANIAFDLDNADDWQRFVHHTGTLTPTCGDLECAMY